MIQQQIGVAEAQALAAGHTLQPAGPLLTVPVARTPDTQDEPVIACHAVPLPSAGAAIARRTGADRPVELDERVETPPLAVPS